MSKKGVRIFDAATGLVSGRTVVAVEGYAGGIALTHVDVTPTEPGGQL